MDAREALNRAADSECDGSSSCPVDRHIHGCFAETFRPVPMPHDSDGLPANPLPRREDNVYGLAKGALTGEDK